MTETVHPAPDPQDRPDPAAAAAGEEPIDPGWTVQHDGSVSFHGFAEKPAAEAGTAVPRGKSLGQAVPGVEPRPSEPVTRVQVLAAVAWLCTEGLPVPMTTDINTYSSSGIWLELRLADPAEVDAWVQWLRIGPAAWEEPPYSSPRAWRRFGLELWHEAAAAAWAPGVGRLQLWCAVYEPQADAEQDGAAA